MSWERDPWRIRKPTAAAESGVSADRQLFDGSDTDGRRQCNSDARLAKWLPLI